jgi:hypothetical protein
MDLLTAIQQNSQQALKKQGVTDETQKAQSLMAAQSGKASSGGGLKQTTNLGEKQAVAQTNQQLGLLGQQNNLQNQQLAGQNQSQQDEFQRQNYASDQDRQALVQQQQIKTGNVLQELRQAKGQIDQQRYESGLKQVAQDLRLGSTKYVDNLQREGNRARLMDANSFDEEMTKTKFKDSTKLLQRDLQGKSILGASDREFTEALGKMDIDAAYATFRSEMQGEKQKALWSGIEGVGKTGISAYGKYSDAKDVDSENRRKSEYYKGKGASEEGYDADKFRNMKFEE